jgi:hypothetical protein
MNRVFTFGVLEIRKSNPITAYEISHRNLELTSVKNFILKYIDAILVAAKHLHLKV